MCLKLLGWVGAGSNQDYSYHLVVSKARRNFGVFYSKILAFSLSKAVLLLPVQQLLLNNSAMWYTQASTCLLGNRSGALDFEWSKAWPACSLFIEGHFWKGEKTAQAQPLKPFLPLNIWHCTKCLMYRWRIRLNVHCSWCIGNSLLIFVVKFTVNFFWLLKLLWKYFDFAPLHTRMLIDL